MSQVINAEAFIYPVFASKAAREVWFREQLLKPEWAVWGLLTIFQYQTEAEKASDVTAEHNNVGFTGVDASLLSSYAKFWNKRGYFSPKQLEYVFKKMPKYAAQLIGHLEGKGVKFVIDKKQAKADAAFNAALVADLPEPLIVAAPTPSIGFGASSTASPKPGEPDWKVYRKALGLSNQLDAVAEYRELVEQYIGDADDFAQGVWETVKGYTGKVPSFKQAKVIAIAIAKVAAGLPVGKQVACVG